MELLTKSCEICGGDLEKIGGKVYKCVCCKNEFADCEIKASEKKQVSASAEKADVLTATRRFITQRLDDLKSGGLADAIPFVKKQTEERVPTDESTGNGTVLCAHQREVSLPRKLVRAEIPMGTTEIENSAFENCVNLEAVVIPNTVTRIGASAFKGCRKLETIVIPPSVTRIDSFAFQDCIRLKRILFPQSVQVIEVAALAGCNSLESITVPFVGVTGREEFAQSKNWLDLGYAGVTHFGVIFGARDYVEQNTVISPKLASVTVAGGYEIDSNAFRGCAHIKKVTIAKSVTFIGKNAFCGCRMMQNVIFLKSESWKKWDGQDSRTRRPSRSLFGDLLMESIPEGILSEPEKAAKLLTKKYCDSCLVSK